MVIRFIVWRMANGCHSVARFCHTMAGSCHTIWIERTAVLSVLKLKLAAKVGNVEP